MKTQTAQSIADTLGIDAAIPEDLLMTDLDFNVDSSVLSNQQLLNDAGDAAREMMTGDIPEDMRDQIEDLSTSNSLSRGLGLGEAGRKLVARDFGLTSMDLRERGIASATSVSAAKSQLTAVAGQVQESRRNFLTTLSDARSTRSQIALQSAEVIAGNQRYVMGLVNDLIIQNSARGISGVQGNVDTLLGNKGTGQESYFAATDRALRAIFDKYA